MKLCAKLMPPALDEAKVRRLAELKMGLPLLAKLVIACLPSCRVASQRITGVMNYQPIVVALSGIAPHPFPYQGSKRRIAKHIVRYVPPGTQKLFEPFAGSAAISIAVARFGKAGSFVINDVDTPLVDLWRCILDNPAKLADQYESLWLSQAGRDRRFYDEVRAAFNRHRSPHHLLYLLARCVKAAVRYNASGDFNNSPDKRRCGMRPAMMRENLVAVSRLLAGRTISRCGDFARAVEDAAPDDLVYMDPPYQGVSNARNHRYTRGINLEDFIAALADLNRRRVPYIVSYDGRTGEKVHGVPLPASLCLHHEEIPAGRSAQATLLGRTQQTVESLYLSPALVERLK